MLPVEPAFKIYADLDGSPLDSGYVYFGQVNQNPITAPVTVYWDAAGTQPAVQPLRTLNGYIVRNGTSANVFVSGNYSQLVRDKNQSQIYYSATSTDYSIADVVTNFITSLASSIGSSLIGFIQSGAGAILRTVQDKLRERVTVEDFGAVGDGVTDSSTAVQKARESLPNGGVLEFGIGTFIIGTTTALEVSASGLTIRGKGSKTILKVKDSAGLGQFLGSNADSLCLKDIVLDGNRANGGTAAGSFGIIMGGSHWRLRNVELRNFTAIAIFIGSGTVSPSDNSIEKCWIHDNGGVTTNTGFGVGIFGGGAFRPNGLRIRSCHFENMYNTVAGFPGDSTATNIVGTNISVIGCTFKNNHNVGGGQLALTSDGSTGLPDGNFIVTGNQVLHDVIVAGENTTAIEIEGRKAVVTGNICQSLNGDGVRFETSGGDAVIADNVITCTNNGVNLIQTGGLGPRKTMIHHNQILSAGTGISSQGNPGGVIAFDNYIDAAIPTKIAGDTNFSLLRGNVNYAPANQIGIVAGASPYTFPLLNYDAFYVCTTVNGMFSANVNGVNVSIAALIPIPVKAGQPFTVFWAGSAPIYSMCPQQ